MPAPAKREPGEKRPSTRPGLRLRQRRLLRSSNGVHRMYKSAKPKK